MAQCTAKSKQSGQQCKRHATPGKRVCKFHGGKSLAGVASPTFIHGKYSKHIPTQLLTRYEESRNDPALLSLADDIALIDARIVELMGGLHDGGVGTIWIDLKKAQNKFEDCMKKGDWVGMQEALVELGGCIKNGATEQQRWDALTSSVFARQRLVESERKRLQEMGQMVTLRELTGLFANLVQILRDRIQDRNVLNGVLHAINEQIFNRDGSSLETNSGNPGGGYLESPVE